MTRDESIRHVRRLRYAKRYNRPQQARQTRLLRATIGTTSRAHVVARCVKHRTAFFGYVSRHDDAMVRAFRALVVESATWQAQA